MEQDEEDGRVSLKSLIEATILAHTEAINNPSVENNARAEALWEQVTKHFQSSPEVVQDVIRRFRKGGTGVSAER